MLTIKIVLIKIQTKMANLNCAKINQQSSWNKLLEELFILKSLTYGLYTVLHIARLKNLHSDFFHFHCKLFSNKSLLFDPENLDYS